LSNYNLKIAENIVTSELIDETNFIWWRHKHMNYNRTPCKWRIYFVVF